MNTLRFNKEEILPLIEHARACRHHRPNLEQLFDPAFRKDGKPPAFGVIPFDTDADFSKVPAGVWLCKGRGVYLMSNGLPRDIVSGDVFRVAYAEGLSPADPDWFGRAADVMGSDEQRLFLGAEDIETGLNAPGEIMPIRVEVEQGLYVVRAVLDVPGRGFKSGLR